ncbi:FAD/NAD(P)-dependent oxidoreductase [Flavisphingomonas formosensis]|uniref:FAD/NAD(P)-dependent oxidoreductase n=1 Tax=Flavisphingomonas formosensis TaxID=861534 RepID=UPI0012FA6973|nr:NAD(P)/FAD-dependent oxidoreductase [Sphingomonas formosensis]
MNVETTDLAIIGAGPAGLAAACEARTLGLSVTVLDEQSAVGGQIYRNVVSAPRARSAILGPDYSAGAELVSAFASSGALHLDSAVVWNVATDGTIDYIREGRTRKLSGKYVLLASGAMERPFPIEGWTLPGVMGAGAAQILLKSAGALPREPVVLAGCGPLLYLLGWQYLRAGARIAALVDTTATSDYVRASRHLMGALRSWKELRKGLGLIAALRRSNIALYSGCSDLRAEGTCKVEALAFRQDGRSVRIPTSLLLVHQGVVPNTQLSWSVKAEHRWNKAQLCWEPVTDIWGRLGETALYVAGDSRSIVGAQASAVQGRLAALSIGNRLGVLPDITIRAAPYLESLKRYTAIRPFLDALYRPKDENRVPVSDKVVVCRCEEVTAGQIRRFVGLGCQGPNQTKAFGRCGMGPCQGRFCGLTVTETIARERQLEPADVGYYRIRPPIKPVLLGDFVE